MSNYISALSVSIILLITACSNNNNFIAHFPNTYILNRIVEECKNENISVVINKENGLLYQEKDLDKLKKIIGAVSAEFSNGFIFENVRILNDFTAELTSLDIKYSQTVYQELIRNDVVKLSKDKYLVIVDMAKRKNVLKFYHDLNQ